VGTESTVLKHSDSLTIELIDGGGFIARFCRMNIHMGPAMKLQLGEFINSIREEREPEASGTNMRRTMQALEAAKLSIASGQVVDTTGM
jgi:predicted dehydrogenase